MRATLHGAYGVDATAVASLALQNDEGAAALVRATEADGGEATLAAVREVTASLGGPAVYRVAFERQHVARNLLEDVM